MKHGEKEQTRSSSHNPFRESRSGERPGECYSLFRKPKTELRFCHFRQKNGPGTSEDRKPKAESRKLGPAPNNENVIREGRITKREYRITFSGAPNNEMLFAKDEYSETRIPNYVFRRLLRITTAFRPQPSTHHGLIFREDS